MSKQAANISGGPRARSMGVGGFDGLYKSLGDLGDVSKRTGTAAVRDGAKMIGGAVEAAAPIGTRSTRKYWKTKGGETHSNDYGRLHQNIRVRKARSMKKTYTGYNITTGNAFWGLFLEFGTVNMAARPWMRGAIDAVKNAAVAHVAKRLKERIEAVAAKRARGK